MRRLLPFGLPWLVACAGAPSWAPPPASAVPLVVALEDAGGVPYPTHEHRGSSFVEARSGDRYRVRLENRRASRVEVVLSVDGVDVITGQPADPRRQRGYVLEPFGSVVVDGYRQSLDHVAAFRFVAPADGYAAADDMEAGMLAAAVFEERPSRTRARAWAPATPGFHPAAPSHETYVTPAAPHASEAAPHASEAAPRASETAPHASEAAGRRVDVVVTGWGETTSQSVRPVRFRRHHRSRPDAVVRLYYEARTSS